MPRRRTPPDPFRWFDSSPEVNRYVVMLYVRYPLSLRNVEDLLHERGIDICYETVRSWWVRFRPMEGREGGDVQPNEIDQLLRLVHRRSPASMPDCSV